jgi:hypothetical protein
MINRESNMLRTLHSERLSKLIDDEQARVLDLEAGHQLTEYENFFMLNEEQDKSWLINYMFVNFERVYSTHEQTLFSAFNDIVQNEQLDDYIGPIKKLYYSDLELEAKSFNVEAFRVLLLFTQTFENFEKIAGYVMRHNRSQLLIYLKKENDNKSSIINSLLDQISRENATDINRVKEIIKEMFNQYSEILVKQCQDDILQELSTENLEDFGDILDMLGESENTKQDTFKIEINQESVKKALQQEIVHQMAEKKASSQHLKKKGIGAKVNLQIDNNEGELNDLKLITLVSNEESPATMINEKKSIDQIDQLSIGNVLSGMMRSSTVIDSSKQANFPINDMVSRRKTFVKTMKSTYEGIKRSQSNSQTDSKLFI